MPEDEVHVDAKRSTAQLKKLQTQAAAIPQDASAAALLDQLELDVLDAELTARDFMSALYTLSSVTINVGAELRDVLLIAKGSARASALLGMATADPIFGAQILQNIANADAEIFHLEGVDPADPTKVTLEEGSRRFGDDSRIVSARVTWKLVADERLGLPGDLRSRALCNLANELDSAGRWVEAYAAYADATDANPMNGNAAGNRAALLLHRLRTSHQQAGHIEAVYDYWARRAKDLRAETVAIAGEHAAQLWDNLPLSDEPVLGHLTHAGDLKDPYQQWIVTHRLALVATVEGLGGGGQRWDTADIHSAVSDSDDGKPPKIFAAMNVVKAEFIVARRLAFRGENMTFTPDGRQHPEDTGEYGSTGDGAVYGEGPATLLLAQRSALDLLDKIAVVANEHFKSGIRPDKVDFAGYWRDPKSMELRPAVKTLGGRLARLALAELQRDLAPGAMYPTARLLRNAGTHRLVHGTHHVATGPTRDTFSTVDLDGLRLSTLEALWVARAAYLYLVDLIDAETPDLGDDALPLNSQH